MVPSEKTKCFKKNIYIFCGVWFAFSTLKSKLVPLLPKNQSVSPGTQPTTFWGKPRSISHKFAQVLSFLYSRVAKFVIFQPLYAIAIFSFGGSDPHVG